MSDYNYFWNTPSLIDVILYNNPGIILALDLTNQIILTNPSNFQIPDQNIFNTWVTNYNTNQTNIENQKQAAITALENLGITTKILQSIIGN